jgi:beta-glucoside operon transcriptional antiterminator
MKVIKNINNNIAHCVDSKGREVVAFGKGIGFFKPDEEIPLNRINRTFYNIKDTDFGLIRQIPTVVVNTAIQIIDEVSDKLNVYYPSSKAISLADHLQFAIERKDQNIYLQGPLIQDIRMLYPDEFALAEKSLKTVEEMTGVRLPRPEAGTLALHFINDRIQADAPSKSPTDEAIERCTETIEQHFDLKIDRGSFNYSRFVTHLDYLIRRLSRNEQIESSNLEIYEQLEKDYPQSFACANKLASYVKEYSGIEPNKEEIMYLVIHINRLISRI